MKVQLAVLAVLLVCSFAKNIVQNVEEIRIEKRNEEGNVVSQGILTKFNQIAISLFNNDQEQRQAKFNLSQFGNIVEFMEEIQFFEMSENYDNDTSFLYPQVTITAITGFVKSNNKVVSFYGNTGPETLHELQLEIDTLLGGLDWRRVPFPAEIWQISFFEQFNSICEGGTNCPPYVVYLDRNGDARLDFYSHHISSNQVTSRLYGSIEPKVYQELSNSLVRKSFFLMDEFYGDSSLSNYVSVGASWGDSEMMTVAEWGNVGPRSLHRIEKDLKAVVINIKWREDIFQRYIYVAIITGGIVLTISLIVVIIVSLLASRYQLRISKSKEEKPMLVFKSDYV